MFLSVTHRGGKGRNMGDDVVTRRTGPENGGDAGRKQRRSLVFRHDAADDQADMAEAGGAQRVHQLRHDQMVGGERRNADDVDILFQRQLDHGGNRLPRRRVNDLHAGIAQIGRDDAAAAIMPVQPDLGDQDARRRR